MSGPTTVCSGNVGVSPNNERKNSVVGFTDDSREDEERRKYLTAKYGQHQMKLIRKRLAVEDWVDVELKKLYNVTDDEDTYETEIDLDVLLDIGKLSDQRRWIWDRICNSGQTAEVLNKFIDELLEKAQTL